MFTSTPSSVAVGYWSVAGTASWDVVMGICKFTRMYYIHVYMKYMRIVMHMEIFAREYIFDFHYASVCILLLLLFLSEMSK